MRTWISKNAATIGAVTGVAALFTIIAGSLLHFLVAQPLNRRFELMEQGFAFANQQSENLEQRMNQRFSAMEQGFVAVDYRFDELGRRMEQGFAHAREAREQNFAHLSQRIENLSESISQLYKLTAAIGEGVSQTGRRIDAIERHLRVDGTPQP